ncbi:hypothetical protein ERJ75_000617300 [Trypanosoma vivax]|nr:hypothetical protein ERJ75_000617300 [Trypanosoma vivax]
MPLPSPLVRRHSVAGCALPSSCRTRAAALRVHRRRCLAIRGGRRVRRPAAVAVRCLQTAGFPCIRLDLRPQRHAAILRRTRSTFLGSDWFCALCLPRASPCRSAVRPLSHDFALLARRTEARGVCLRFVPLGSTGSAASGECRSAWPINARRRDIGGPRTGAAAHLPPFSALADKARPANPSGELRTCDAARREGKAANAACAHHAQGDEACPDRSA